MSQMTDLHTFALNARTIGSGNETIVLCHGFGTDQSIWDKIIPLLAENYTLVLFDWPFSGAVTDKSLYDHAKYTSFEPYADDLITIIDEMDLKCVTFVGHSMSAMIGCIASAKKPEVFKRLILVAASPRNIEFPLSWPLSANIQKFENVHSNANEGETNVNEDTSDAENSKVEDEECTLLMKYCLISRGYMLCGQDSLQVDLPYGVTDEQRNIVLFPQIEEVYGFTNYANLEESKEIASETEKPVLRQLFVTLSPGLCQKVQHHVSFLKRMDNSSPSAKRSRPTRQNHFWLDDYGGRHCPQIPREKGFHDRVQNFIQETCEAGAYFILENPFFRVSLAHKTTLHVMKLYVVENISEDSTCTHCSSASFHDIVASEEAYHFIIPKNEKADLEIDALTNQSHLLHGMIHSSGYGHLLCINGTNGGKIATEDLSKKRFMDLRLLHGVAFGHSWFSRWEYKYNGPKEVYNNAMKTLNSLELDIMRSTLSDTKFKTKIERMIRFYVDLSETRIISLRDILLYMLHMKDISLVTKTKVNTKEKSTGLMELSTAMYEAGCNTWSTETLGLVAHSIFNALKECRDKGTVDKMSTEEIIQAVARQYNDRNLVVYVLGFLNNVIIDDYIICRTSDARTKKSKHEYAVCELNEREIASYWVPGKDVYSDVLFLYKHVLLGYTEPEVKAAVNTILDAKLFVKEWPSVGSES
ncbi:PHD finger protein MALE MEIOCYTE DEATH 1 [Spatholobus suberectus]|nr:PHD finger protein MALE MEIOCYTE DEATH 1 [Spatholobus suberectus]